MIFFSSQTFAWEKTYRFGYLGQKFEVTLTMVDDEVKTCSQQIWDWQNAHGSLSKYKTDSLLQYVFFPCSNELIKSLNSQLYEIFTNHFETKKDRAQLLIAFVNSIPYQSDSKDYADGDYWQYPFETLYLGHGDCEDHAFLLTDLFRRNGFDSLILELPTHMACGIDSFLVNTDFQKPYLIEYGGHEYYYCEAVGPKNEIDVGGHQIGEVGVDSNCVPIRKAFVKGKDQFVRSVEKKVREFTKYPAEENIRLVFRNGGAVEILLRNERADNDMGMPREGSEREHVRVNFGER